MSEAALRGFTLFGLAALGAALLLGAWLRGAQRPRPETSAALCGAIVQVGLYSLLIAAWRGTGSEGWPVPTAGFLLCALPGHAFCVIAAARNGARTLPVTLSLFVLAALGVAWGERIGSRGPLLVALAFTAGLVATGLFAGLSRRAITRRVLPLLASPWFWAALCLAVLGLTRLFGVDVGGTVVGARVFGVFVQPTELAYKLLLPPLVGTGLVHYVRRIEADPPARGLSRMAAALPLGVGVIAGFVAPMLLLREHGTLVLGGLVCVVTVLAVGRGRDLLVPAALVAVVAAGVAVSEPRVRTRLEGLVSPACESGRESEQRCTAATAAASSDGVGQGIASGRAAAVPQAETDFPVSGFLEELGLPGAVVLWLALALLCSGVFRELHEPPRRAMRSATVAAMLAAIVVQAAWNHWMNLGLVLPVMGVPFPWLSFSGTTVLASTLGAGVAASLAWGAPRPMDPLGHAPVDAARGAGSALAPAVWALAALCVLGAAYRASFREFSVHAFNPRLSASPRGQIVDAGGVALATGSVRERRYPLGAAAVHVVGYKRSLAVAAGMESRADAWLSVPQGWPGPLDREGHVPRDLVLTLEAPWQRAAHAALGDRRGAVVVMDADGGEVVASVSTPGFAPRELTRRFASLRDDPDEPFLDRATARSAPGSTFKLLLARHLIGAGEEGFRYTCPGRIATTGGRFIRCSEPHGEVELARALAVSCNGYFVQAAAQGVGGSPLPTLREVLGEDFPGEADLDQTMGRALLVIGQGNARVAPMRMAAFAASHFGQHRAGEHLRPKLVSSGPGDAEPALPVVVVDRADHRDRLVEMMDAAAAPVRRRAGLGGTCRLLGAKTGTAETPDEDDIGWLVGALEVPGQATPTRTLAFAIMVEEIRGFSLQHTPGVLGRMVRDAEPACR